MRGLLDVFAELERDFLSERVIAGIEETRRKGKIIVRPEITEAKKESLRNVDKEKIQGQNIEADRCFEKINFQNH